MSEFTTSDCVTVDITMVFLCPFLGEKKEAYNDEKRNTVNDLVAVVTYYGLAWLLLIKIFLVGTYPAEENAAFHFYYLYRTC